MDAQTKRDKINLITERKIYFQDPSIKRAFESEYNIQAINFLLETNTKCFIEFSHKGFPSWQNKDQVNIYSVTLKNEKSSYTFKFYDSIKNTQDRKMLTLDFYSVLACLEIYTPENFDEFCSEHGYEFKNESDYIRVKKIHLECIDQTKALRKLFTSEQLEKLSEIR